MEEIMKNIIRRGLCLLLLLAMTATMAACGPKNTNTGTDEETMVYAVEAGSAGEEVAKEKGWTVNSVQDQAAAMMEVAAGTSDAAVIDLLMAGAMIGPDTSYPNLTYTDSLTQEEYGIGCRQGSDLADFITSVLAEAYQDGTTQTLARQFGIREDLLAEMPQTGYTEDAGGDVAYIRGKGTLVVGITEFAPMDYKDDNGQWTGFDAELARLVALGSMSRCRPVRALFDALVWVIRGTPLVLQLIIIFYGPGLWFGHNIWGSNRMLACTVAFVLNYACYFSVIYRGGIQAVPAGQREAGQVLGLTRRQIFFKITLLQVVKRILPPMSNEIITLVKDTSLARIIAIVELTKAGEDYVKTAGITWPLFYTGVYYLLFVGLLTLLFRYLERRLSYFR